MNSNILLREKEEKKSNLKKKIVFLSNKSIESSLSRDGVNQEGFLVT